LANTLPRPLRTLADVRHVFDFAFQKGWVASDPSSLSDLS